MPSRPRSATWATGGADDRALPARARSPRSPPGRRLRACGRWRSSGPGSGGSGSGGRRRCSRTRPRSSGRMWPGSARRTSRRAGRPGPIEGPAVVAASWFAPSGAAITLAASVRRLVHERHDRRLGLPAGARVEGSTATGPAVEIDGIRLRGAFDLITALERAPGGGLRRFPRARQRRPVPEGSIVLGDPGDVICWARRSSRAWSSTCGMAPSCWRKGSRSATAPGWKARCTSGRRPAAGRIPSAPRSFGPECRVHGEVVGKRLPRLRQQEPRRVRRPQRGGPLGEPGRGDHDLESRRTPMATVRLDIAGAPDRDRPAQPRHPVRRSRQDGDRHHARDRDGDLGAGANVFGAPTRPSTCRRSHGGATGRAA